MTFKEWLYLGLVAPVLLGMMIVAFWLLHREENDRAFQARFKLATQTRPRVSNPAGASTVTLLRNSGDVTAWRRFAVRVLGVDFYQSQFYPFKWWIGVLMMLMSSGVIVELVIRIFGHGPLIQLAGFPILFLVLVRSLMGYLNNRRRSKLFEQFSDALSSIVRSVRIGMPITEALRLAGRDAPMPTQGEFARLSNQVAIGIPLDQAIIEMARDNNLAEYYFFAAAISLQAKSGGSIGITLENLSNVIRQRLAIKERGFALTSEARMSAKVLTGLPIFTTGALIFMSPSYIEQLVTTHQGNKFLGISIILLLTGQGVMQRMIRKTLNSVR